MGSTATISQRGATPSSPRFERLDPPNRDPAAPVSAVCHRRPPHGLKGVIAVSKSADGTVDAVSHTDGLDVSSASLPDFPKGILVVQDDANPTSEVDQNFKIVDWRSVEAALGLAN
jgi:3-phytase